MKIKDNVFLYFIAFIVLIIVFIQLSFAFSDKKQVEETLGEAPASKMSPTSIPTSNLPKQPVILSNITEGDTISSPVTIQGKALGTWFFEGVMPVKILNADGKVLANVAANADGDWMTSEYVNFKAVASFVADTDTGKIVFQKDNPSGLPENDLKIEINVRF